LLGVCALAQTPTGTVQGLVTDKTGAIIPNASVTVIRVATNEIRSTVSDSGGRYQIPFVSPGIYTIKVEAKGFRQSQQSGIQVSVTETRPVNFQLEVGTVSETVEVSAAAQSLDVDTSSVGQTIQSQLITELPDSGRNPFNFASLVPGVNTTGSASTPHIAGSRNGNNEQQIDGMTNILPENNIGNNSSAYQPVMDSVEEINVQTSVLPAEFGRFSGGTISLITKSGTNQLHGSFFEFVQNGTFDAVPFGTPGEINTSTKPDMNRYQTGGTIGGPIALPHLYNGRNKTFFFFDYEKSQETDGSSGTYSVPLTAWKSGDFTALYGSTTPYLYDPYTVAEDSNGNYVRTALIGDDGSYNKIPSKYLNTSASKVAQAVLAYYPTPNVSTTSGINNFTVASNSKSRYWHYDARIDHNVTKNWHSFLRWAQEYTYSEPVSAYASVKNGMGSPTGDGPTYGSALSISFNNTVTFSPTLLGEFRYGYSRGTAHRQAISTGFDVTTLGLPQSLQNEGSSNASIFPSFNFKGGYSTVGNGGWVPLKEDPLAQDFNGSIIKIAGTHSLKFGGEFRILRMNFFQYGYPTGYFYTDGSWTRYDPQVTTDNTGFSYADFLMGLSSTSSYIDNRPKTIQTSEYAAFYGEDNWKVTPKLTLNLGLRYDFEIPRIENNNQLTYWDPYESSPIGSVSAASGVTCTACSDLRGAMHLVNSSDSRYGRRQGPTQWHDFAPRIGFAYNPVEKLAIRGGAGIIFQPSAMQAGGTTGAAGVEGYSTSTSMDITNDNEHSTPLVNMEDPFPSYNVAHANSSTCRASASCVAGIDIGSEIYDSFFGSYRNPYSIQWSTTVQLALSRDIKLELGYMANRGLFLIDGDPGRSYDQLPTSYLSQGSSLLNTVANPFYDTIGSFPYAVSGSSLSSSTISANQLLRKWPQYNGVESYRKPGASSMYNALTIKLDKQFSHGFSYTISFTDGREYDDAASVVSYLGNTSQTYADQYNPKAEWSIGAQNINYMLAASFVYELPFGHGKLLFKNANDVANKIINGWQIVGIEKWDTGTPIMLGSVDNGTTAEAIFTQSQRPAWTGASSKLPVRTHSRWFNTSQFSTPAAYTIGNSPRTLSDVSNPGTQNTDITFMKNTAFGLNERCKVQLRLEMFNAFNHPILSNPDTTVTDSAFGSVSSYSNNSRRLQLAAKVSF
jgi:hypothetical protein